MKYTDDRFLISAAFWSGSIAFNLPFLAIRNYVFIPMVVIGFCFMNIVVIGAVIFWITDIGKAMQKMQIQQEKVLD